MTENEKKTSSDPSKPRRRRNRRRRRPSDKPDTHQDTNTSQPSKTTAHRHKRGQSRFKKNNDTKETNPQEKERSQNTTHSQHRSKNRTQDNRNRTQNSTDRRPRRNRNRQNRPQKRFSNKISEHFTKNDFDSRKDNCECKSSLRISLGLVGVLESLQSKLNKKITIVTGYYCPDCRPRQYGIKRNFHSMGVAADITAEDTSNMDLFLLAETYPEIKGLGINLDDGHVHVDTRKEDASETWVETNNEMILITEENRATYISSAPIEPVQTIEPIISTDPDIKLAATQDIAPATEIAPATDTDITPATDPDMATATDTSDSPTTHPTI
jgi:hypothetical protein